MDDTKVIKTIFGIDAISIIADTADDKVGEASTGYEYHLNTSLPELAFAFAGFLKAMESDPDIKEAIKAKGSVAEAFLNLVQLYYTKAE